MKRNPCAFYAPIYFDKRLEKTCWSSLGQKKKLQEATAYILPSIIWMWMCEKKIINKKNKEVIKNNINVLVYSCVRWLFLNLIFSLILIFCSLACLKINCVIIIWNWSDTSGVHVLDTHI